MIVRRLVTFAAAASLGLAAGLPSALAFAEGALSDRRVQVGDTIDDVELRTVDGKREHLLAKGVVANVVVFFRPQQEHSIDTLKDFAGCEKEFVGKPVRWVGIVSDSWSADEVKSLVAETAVKMPVLFDEGDALYGKLGIRLHPVVGIVDAKRKLAAYEPFREINYCARIAVRVKLLLGEATEEDVARVDNPPKATTRTDSGVARRHLNFARTLMRIGQNDKALAEVEKSLAIEPGAPAFVLQGQLLAALGKCPDAVRAFDAALKIEPANAVAKEGKTGCGR
jgi:tetratricopeptide (TPR) repeat protein